MSSVDKVDKNALAPIDHWFHLENQFYFCHRSDGSVSIEQYALNQKPMKQIPIWRLHITRDGWVSIIGQMSMTHRDGFELPYQFHMGVKPDTSKSEQFEADVDWIKRQGSNTEKTS